MTQPQMTYSRSLLDELHDIPINPTRTNFHKLLGILENTLLELERHEIALEQHRAAIGYATNTASCLANGIRPD